VSVGRNTRIECTGNLQTLGVGIRVGNNVGLGTDSFYGCAGGISIGDDTIIGNYVTFHSENHEASRADVPIRLQGVTHAGITVGKNCWLGAKTTVLDGAVIEDGCVFAAGSVVTAGHYPANTIYGGVPARSIRGRVSNGLKSA
jgi:acetyltransferase-like isoleucine patch superfamily enzyme